MEDEIDVDAELNILHEIEWNELTFKMDLGMGLGVQGHIPHQGGVTTLNMEEGASVWTLYSNANDDATIGG